MFCGNKAKALSESQDHDTRKEHYHLNPLTVSFEPENQNFWITVTPWADYSKYCLLEFFHEHDY